MLVNRRPQEKRHRLRKRHLHRNRLPHQNPNQRPPTNQRLPTKRLPPNQRPPRNQRPPSNRRRSSQEGPETRTQSSPRGELASTTWEALGTSVVLLVTAPETLTLALGQVERELDAIDCACSRFRADSELSRVNAHDGRPVQIGQLLMEALELALRAAELTDGAVDPTIGRALELAGYDRDWRLLTPAFDDASPQASKCASSESTGCPQTITVDRRSGWRTVALDRKRVCVSVPRGIRLDLGATAKGWAADRAAHAAAQAAGCGVLVSIGGDISTSGTSPAGGWRIRVTDDHRSPPSAPGQTVTALSGGLATSSTAVRRWHHDGRTMHHIIDPRTGAPARTPWRTVSVAAASCADANIATTAALVKGATAPAWLAALGLPARLVDHEGHVVYVGDWPRELERDV